MDRASARCLEGRGFKSLHGVRIFSEYCCFEKKTLRTSSYLFVYFHQTFAQTCHYLQIIIIIIITTIIIIIIITVVLVSLIVNIFIIQILILSDLEILLLTAAHCNINDFKLLLLLLL